MPSTFERHDRFNFEAKIDYELDLSSQKNKYFLTFYFFVPKSLKITRHTYSKNEFYNDLYTYIRFRVPRFSLAEIIETGNRRSPLWQIRSNLDILRHSVSSDIVERKIIYELRMLGVIHTFCLKTEVINLLRESVFETKQRNSGTEKKIREFISGIKTMGEIFADIGTELQSLAVSRELRETYAFAQDYISLNLQTHLTTLMGALIKLKGKEYKSITEDLVVLIEAERNRRISRKSPLVRDSATNNEEYTYREGILKKFFQGVLYLEVKDRDKKEAALHVLYGIAAGVAMFLSLILGFWIGGKFSNQQSMSFIMALVFAYIVKDRTKELIRNYSSRFIRLFFHDRRFEIIDPLTEEDIGYVRENMRFAFPSEVPEEIWGARTLEHSTVVESKGKPEEVIVYEKEVVLDTQKISKRHTRHRDINDIIRFNIRNFIQYADDPFHFDKVWDPAKKKIERVRCAKIYHLNLIIRLDTLSGPKQKKRITFKHVRVILNQDGIMRMKEKEFAEGPVDPAPAPVGG
jgi:hypothetical protein